VWASFFFLIKNNIHLGPYIHMPSVFLMFLWCSSKNRMREVRNRPKVKLSLYIGVTLLYIFELPCDLTSLLNFKTYQFEPSELSIQSIYSLCQVLLLKPFERQNYP
jgi:hypothetical protein